jgi:uncharacterized protein (TIGR03437 family)
MFRSIVKLILTAIVPIAWSQPQITAVVNAATFQPGLPSGGGLATLYCTGPVTSAAPGVYLPASSSSLPNTLVEIQVAINGAYAPILAVVVTKSNAVLYTQVNFQVPMERNVSLPNGGGYAGGLTSCNGASVQPLPAQTTGGFFADANGYAIAQHASDYSLVTPQNPAHPGESITAYADDVFPVWPPPTIGIPTPAQPLFQQTDGLFASGYLYLQPYPVAKSGGPGMPGPIYPPATLPLQTTFMGMAPGMVGVQQINFVVPANQPAGTLPLFFDDGCPPGYVAQNCAAYPAAGPSVLFPVD